MNSRDLDRYITGNHGEDQGRRVKIARPDPLPALWEHVADLTAFDEEAPFDSPDDVRGYFQRDNLEQLFGPEAFIPDQDTLNAWAAEIIRHAWHCTFSPETV